MKLQRIIAAPLAVGIALGLTACGVSSTTPPGISREHAGWDINETARGNLRRGGELRGAVDALATNWNPLSVEGAAFSYSRVRGPMSASFFDYDSLGVAVANPDYISSVTVKNAPSTVITLAMNPLAVWGDGQPIVAADWIATWKAMNGSNEAFRVITTQGWSSLANVAQGTDSHEVVFTFKAAYPDWTQIIAGGPLRKESCDSPAAFNSGWADLKNDYFAGPFKVFSVDKTQKIVTLVPNDRWWGAEPLLEKITWRAITPEAVASAFQSNEIDFFDVGVDADAYARAKTVSSAAIRLAPGTDFRHFTFNSSAGVLKDQTVRQAIAMGLDRKSIAASDLAGLDVDAQPLNNNILMTNQQGYEDMAAKTGIDYNIFGAKQKLEAAGWTLNSSTGYFNRAGQQLDVRFTQITGVRASENEALQAKQMLKQIGVNVIIQSVSTADFNDPFLNGGGWDIIAFSWMGTAYPFTGPRQLYGKGSQSNYAHLSVPGLDRLFDQIDVETDPDKRIGLANQAAEKIWTAVHTLPLYQRPAIVAVKSSLANFGSVGLGSIKWENVGYT